MSWYSLFKDPPTPHPERGPPGPRLVRGVLWALLLIAVISVIVFALLQCVASYPRAIF